MFCSVARWCNSQSPWLVIIFPTRGLRFESYICGIFYLYCDTVCKNKNRKSVATKPGLWQWQITALNCEWNDVAFIDMESDVYSKWSIIFRSLYFQYYLFNFYIIKYRNTSFVLRLIKILKIRYLIYHNTCSQ